MEKQENEFEMGMLMTEGERKKPTQQQTKVIILEVFYCNTAILPGVC